jgi:hypothetical protein
VWKNKPSTKPAEAESKIKLDFPSASAGFILGLLFDPEDELSLQPDSSSFLLRP